MQRRPWGTGVLGVDDVWERPTWFPANAKDDEITNAAMSVILLSMGAPCGVVAGLG